MSTEPMVLIEMEIECTQWTPGAYWVYGCDYWEVQAAYEVPAEIAQDAELIEDYILEHY